MSAAGEAIRWAGGKQAGVAAVIFFFLVFELCQGILQELEEYKRSAAERPLVNLFEGGGAEVLVLFLLVGAAFEALAHHHAERALHRATIDVISVPPFVIWVALGACWDIILACPHPPVFVGRQAINTDLLLPEDICQPGNASQGLARTGTRERDVALVRAARLDPRAVLASPLCNHDYTRGGAGTLSAGRRGI